LILLSQSTILQFTDRWVEKRLACLLQPWPTPPAPACRAGKGYWS